MASGAPEGRPVTARLAMIVRPRAPRKLSRRPVPAPYNSHAVPSRLPFHNRLIFSGTRTKPVRPGKQTTVGCQWCLIKETCGLLAQSRQLGSVFQWANEGMIVKMGKKDKS